MRVPIVLIYFSIQIKTVIKGDGFCEILPDEKRVIMITVVEKV